MNRPLAVRAVSGIGAVQLKRTKRARKIGIRIHSPGRVVLVVPWNVGFTHALEILEKHRLWVGRKLARIREREADIGRCANTDIQVVRGHRLLLGSGPVEKCLMEIGSGVIRVTHPPNLLGQDDPEVRKTIRDGLLEACRREAKDVLPERVRQLADRHRYPVGRVVLKNLRSRWGSCSPANSINLNIQLMRLQADLVDYVILHELAHTRVRNHGIEFWNELSGALPEARLLDRRLRAERVWD